MDADNQRREAVAATDTFERELGSLILSAFGRGAAVEGTWTIGGSTPTVPEWTVEITKSARASTKHDPEFVE